MKMRLFKHKVKHWAFTVRQWSCCGHIWQLMLSRNYPARYNWKPICPDCGSSTLEISKPKII